MLESLPRTSAETAWHTFQDCVSDPNGFLRRTAVSLNCENPVFLDASLYGAANVSIKIDPRDAQQILAGSFFRYECTAREIKKQGGKIPFIGEKTIQKSAKEVASLTRGLILSQSDPNAALRQRVMRIEREDPEVGNILKQIPLKDADPFIEGAHSTHLTFVFLNPNFPEQADKLTEPTASSVLPLVRRSIIRSALLETILDQDSFIKQTITDAAQHFPRMAERVIMTARPAEKYSDIYLLFASFTINGIMQELYQKESTFPIIKEININTHPDPVVNRALNIRSAEAGRLIRNYNLSILGEIENTNPHLYWGLSALMYPLAKLNSPALNATMLNGIVNPYSSLKTGLS